MPSDNFSRPGAKKPLKKPAKKTVRKTRAPVTDVQSTGGYKKKPVVAAKGVTGSANAGGRKTTGVSGTAKAPVDQRKKLLKTLKGRDESVGDTLRSLAEAVTPSPVGRSTRLEEGLKESGDKAAAGVVYAGEGLRNVIRRLQGGRDHDPVRAGFSSDIAERAARNLPVDIANTAVNAVPAAAHIASELGKGHVGRAAHDLVAPYVEIAKHPGRELVEHPFSTTALLTGPVRGVSRGGGAAARRGAFGKKARRAASTDREPARTVEPTRLVEPRRYSPDPVGKAFQVAKEKGRVPFTGERKARKLRKKAGEATKAGRHGEAAGLRDEASRHDPVRMHEDQVKRRVDEIRDTNEVVRRVHAQNVDKAVRGVREKPKRRLARSKPLSAAVSLTAQKIVYPTTVDLRAFLAEVEAAARSGELSGRQLAANEQLRGQIERALDHPEDWRAVQAAADRYLAVERPITQKLVRHKMLDPEETAKRRELPFAARKLGAARDTKPRLTEAGTNALILKQRRTEAAQRVVEAQRAVDRARTTVDRDAAKVALTAAKTEAVRLRGEAKTLRKANKGKPLKKAPGWVDEHGRPFTAAQMRAERELGGVDAVTGQTTRTPLPGEPAYVSHAPNITRPGSFYRDSGRPVSAGGKAFTGGSVTKGTLDASEHALHANARRLQSLLDAHEGHAAFLDEVALRARQGNVIHGDRNRVQAAIDKATLDERGHKIPGTRQWRIVRTNPFGGRQAQLDKLIESLNEHGELHSNEPGGTNPVVGALEDALAGRGDGPFVAIPEEAAVQLEKHLRQLGSQTGQVWNVVNTLWRKNVLAFSPKWAASNVAEASERSLIAGVRPGDRALLKRTVAEWKKTDPAAAERFLATIGQGHFGFVRRNQRFATSTEFADPARNGRFVRFAARVAGTIERTPVANWLPRVYSEYTGMVMSQMGRLESQFRLGMAGKRLRDLTQGGRTFADLSEKGLAQALEGIKGSPVQIETARFVRKAYGQYEAFSPTQRAWIATYTPFLAWTKNAAQFLLLTLPRDHPVVVAIAADLTRSQEPWLRDLGLWLGEKDSLPAYLMGNVPVDGGLLKAAKYTPQSAAADPVSTIASLVLPSGQNILMAARGLDPFGNPLKGSRESAILKGLLGLVLPGPVAPHTYESSATLMDTLNPVQVIPREKVEYARVKATLDRLNKQIENLPADAKVRRNDGSFRPEYRELLDEQADLQARRDGLLVDAGFKTDPALPVRNQLRLINRQIRDLPASQRSENGLESKTLVGLRKTAAQLGAVEKALGPQYVKPKKLRKRPLTTEEKVRESVRKLRKRDVRGEIEAEIQRLRDQAKVNREGG